MNGKYAHVQVTLAEPVLSAGEESVAGMKYWRYLIALVFVVIPKIMRYIKAIPVACNTNFSSRQ